LQVAEGLGVRRRGGALARCIRSHAIESGAQAPHSKALRAMDWGFHEWR
jgi:hypothetical protein